MDEQNVVYIHNGIQFSYKRNKDPAVIAKLIEMEDIMLSGISQTQKNKYHTFSLIYGKL
jgi:hypothetical protein